MLGFASWLLQCARTYGQRFFLQFGLHCATHQIRIILVSCVVITSLFYPALALYSSQAKSISIFDTLISPNSGFHAQQDLVDLWTGYASLRAREDAVSRARCGNGQTVRLERVLIQGALADDDGAVNHRILLSTLNFESKLERYIPSCLKKPDGKCFVLSPLAFWNYDENTLLSDSNIFDTLNLSRNVSVAGIPVTPQMVLAGRGASEPTLDFANFLALTYFFPESGCFGTSEHASWLQAVKAAADQKSELTMNAHEPALIALEYDATLANKRSWSAISAFLYLSYASFFIYVFWSMRQITTVHSRVGLAFTALVEIVVSTITSLSVCALVGFKVTLVPWELLPIVIVFVGAENMFNLVDAVGKTPVTLSVKQRIADGLSRAGTSNTLKVVSYNAILGVIAVFAAGAIRQFCVFAIVVLVAHWFLAHTFFMAVLSIDIQRLELDELLQQDSGLAPTPTPNMESMSSSKPTSTWRKMGFILRRLLSGRAKKNLSLFLLLAITATLYYATMPPDSPVGDANVPLAKTRGALSRNPPNPAGTVGENASPEKQIWKMLNPGEATLHLRVEAPTILTFQSTSDHRIHQIVDSKSHKRLARTMRSVLWLMKIMVLPIAATTFLLWILTLYLLKDAELLDAQKNRAEPGLDDAKQNITALEQQVSFSTLPRAFTSDVELIATSADGRAVISVGLHNEVMIWRTDSQKNYSIDATDVLRAASSSLATSTITSVAMNDKGHYCALGTGAGVIAIWDIRKDKIRALPHLSLPDSSAGVVEIQFVPTASKRAGSSTSEPASPVLAPVDSMYVVAIYENGVAIKYAVRDVPAFLQLCPSRVGTVLRSRLIRLTPEDRLVVAFCMGDGTVDLLDAGDSNALIRDDFSIQAGNPADKVSIVHICRASLRGETRVVVAAATEAGVISLWDGQTGECIRILDEAYGKINQLRVFPVQSETCHFCGHMPPESFSICFSVGHVVRIFKHFVEDDSRHCSCTSTAPRRMSSRDNLLGRRSRSNSVSSVGSNTPSISRKRKPSTSDISPFPVSGHGIHSRRASEKDSNRRISDIFNLPIESEEGEVGRTVGPTETTKPSTLWQSSYIVRVADTTCERGAWDVYENRIVGVRRKPRPPPAGKFKSATNTLRTPMTSKGLSMTTLERWEIWTFDPFITHLQCSSLSSIMVVADELDLSSSISSPTHTSNYSIPRIPFTRVTPFIVARSRSLAGFGNTLGVFNFLKI